MGTTTIVEREDGLVTVTLNRPQRKNAISASMWNELDEILSEVEVEPRRPGPRAHRRGGQLLLRSRPLR